MKTIKLFGLLAIALITFSACSDDDNATPQIINEEEVITTVNVTLTDQNGNVKNLSFVDPDGDGPNEPITNADDLDANTVYSGTIEFLNELETPAGDITVEVAEEDLDHQVFYVPSSDLNATISYNDQDANGNPVGLDFTLTTGDASSGTLTVRLIHLPIKEAPGVSSGDPTNASGETDVEAPISLDIL
ncbi:type 1 periplasmic binding fold superfamily protein [Flavobacteriaceae bacterium 14752]|uniref:type 1 periplasmic binding fold superfamily protein n=1 Tax=Mesohalobacter salilacus TaxID=2491711 RepID=UPI000F62E1A0|nr:type 1 periplasmic binding fold superfamily protein [Flavobacteriaceae bacterium 14752]